MTTEEQTRLELDHMADQAKTIINDCIEKLAQLHRDTAKLQNIPHLSAQSYCFAGGSLSDMAVRMASLAGFKALTNENTPVTHTLANMALLQAMSDGKIRLDETSIEDLIKSVHAKRGKDPSNQTH